MTVDQPTSAPDAPAPKRASRTGRLIGGLIMTYGYQAVLIVTGIWLTPFYLRHIGQTDYGLWLIGAQLLTYLTLSDFGVVALLPMETAYATGRAGGAEKADDLPRIVGQTTRIVLYQLPIVILIAAGMYLTIPAKWQGLHGPLAVILIGFILGFPLRVLPAVLQGLQDLTFANGLQIVIFFITTTSTVLMVTAGWSLYALAIGWLVSQFIATPVWIYRLMTRFPGVLPRRLPPMVWQSARTQLGKGFWISVAQIAQLLMSNTDLLIGGRIFGPAALVPYSCTGKLPGVLGNQAPILMHTATPALCELKTGESHLRVFQALVALNQAMLTFSGLVFCVVVVVNHWFVDWWVTAKQYGGATLTLVVLTNMIIRHWTTVSSYTVFCFGHQRRISLTNLADGLVTAGSTIVLSLLFGLPGTAAGSIAGACLVSLPCNLVKISRDLDIPIGQLAKDMVFSWAWRFALVAGGCLLLARQWSPSSLPAAAAVSVAVTIVYIAVMLPNVLRAPLGSYVRPMLASFWKPFAALAMRPRPSE